MFLSQCIHINTVFKKFLGLAEEMAQQLGARTALPEDLSLVPSTRVRLTSCTSPAPEHLNI